MANWFDRVLRAPRVQTSVFTQNNDYKTAIGIGEAVPVYIEECLPKDKFLSCKQEVFMRFAPLMFPVLHRINVHTRNFFVPIRIIIGDDRYQDFLNNKHDITPMTIMLGAITDEKPASYWQALLKNSLVDYLGIDINSSAFYTKSYGGANYCCFRINNPLPLFAYMCIIRDWFTDEVLNENFIGTCDTFLDNYLSNWDNNATEWLCFWSVYEVIFQIWRVAYGRDYFSSARPTPIQGPDQFVLDSPLKISPNPASPATDYSTLFERYDGRLTNSSDGSPDLKEMTTIRSLWRKEMLQRFYENDARGGTRIREKLFTHFGVEMSDKRLMIARYLGGTDTTAKVSEVVQTSESSASSPLGGYAGKASAIAYGGTKEHFCEEHGFYLSIISVVPENGYCQGNARFWYKNNIFDYAFPEFNNIGWQQIYKGEVFSQGMQRATDLEDWAYQPRYSEYRAHRSLATGEMRSSQLLSWHLNRNFASLPPLNDEFIKIQQADTNRIFNYEGGDEDVKPLFVDVYNHVTMSRPIAYEPDSMHLY